MKKILISFLLFLSSYLSAQVTPTNTVKVNSSIAAFGINIPTGYNIIDCSTGTEYYTLQSVVSTKSISTCVLGTDIKKIGTVSTISVTGNNGITQSVTNPTTTPAITLGLGAITPTSVSATGTVTGTRLISNIVQGTSPLSVTSTTLVPNLNVSFLGGHSSDYFLPATGTAVSALTVDIDTITTGSDMRIPFMSSTGGNQKLYMDNVLKYNTGTGQLTVNYLSGVASNSTKSDGVYITSDFNSDFVTYIPFLHSYDDYQMVYANDGLTYNPLNYMLFTNLTGNVTGNVSGSSGSCTGNSATASQVAVTETGSVDADYNVIFVNSAKAGSTSNKTVYMQGGVLKYNPSATLLSANLDGIAGKATNLVGGTIGSIPYQSSVDATTMLAGNALATKKFLSSTGTGIAANAPTWQTVTKADVLLGNVENTALSTWTGSTNITTLGTIATGTWNATAIGITKGGTGATTKATAFDALSPMTTAGDLIYGGTSGTGTRLAKGSAYQALTMNSGATAPVWATIIADAINNGTTTIAPSENAVYDALTLKANLASPALTGTPTAPTASTGTNTTQIATTAFVSTAISNATLNSEIKSIYKFTCWFDGSSTYYQTYSCSASDWTVLMDADVTELSTLGVIYLPNATNQTGRVIHCVNVSDNSKSVKVLGANGSGQTIFMYSSGIVLERGESVELQTDGSSWYIISGDFNF